MLDESLEEQEGGGSLQKPVVVSHAVEFLKGMLDFMLELHIHTEVSMGMTPIIMFH